MDISQLHHAHNHHPGGRDVGVKPSPSTALKAHLDSPTSVTSHSSAGGAQHTLPLHSQHYQGHQSHHGHDPVKAEYSREMSGERSPENSDEPAKKKQKRNKPTLSCHECVERKTKVCCFEPIWVHLNFLSPTPSIFNTTTLTLILYHLSSLQPQADMERHVQESKSMPLPACNVAQHGVLSLIALLRLRRGASYRQPVLVHICALCCSCSKSYARSQFPQP